MDKLSRILDKFFEVSWFTDLENDKTIELESISDVAMVLEYNSDCHFEIIRTNEFTFKVKTI